MSQEEKHAGQTPRPPKKLIPHPSSVPAKHHGKVLGLVQEQFANGHYGVEEGSVDVVPLSPGRDEVRFVRTHDVTVPAEHHGLDLSE